MKKIWFITLLMAKLSFAIDLELTQGINAAIPVAIEAKNQNVTAKEIAAIIKNDFGFSGQFRIVEANSNFAQQPWDTWQRFGADHVITIEVTPGSNEKNLSVVYQLQDIALRGQVSNQQLFAINSNQIRALSHHIADEIYKQITGQRGVFVTKLAYIKVQRSTNNSRYSLEVADLDGFNPRQLLVSSEPIMSPSWSPDGSSIAYVSFENRKPQIFQVMVATGQRRLITDFVGINGAPAWSPDGKQMAVVLSKSGSPKIYLVDIATGSMKQLTTGSAIDTEPRFSPDGNSIVFTSGREGNPQVYKISLLDGSVRRLTYDGNYNARPALTANQDLVVIHRQEDKSFNIGVQHQGSNQIIPITHSSMDESPSVAPNGRLVVYATSSDHQGLLGIASLDGNVQIKLPARDGDVQEPAWSPFFG